MTVAKAWDDTMTVTVDDGPARRLNRAQNLELEPGSHVLTFELDAPRLLRSPRDPGQPQARADAGAVEVPLQRPGTLTVQQAISAPIGPGDARRRDLGPQPGAQSQAPPGRAQARDRSLRAEADGSGRVALEVTIKPRTAVTVTFDLRKPDGGATVREAAATGG